MADTGVRTPPAPSALAAFKARVASLGSRPHRRGQAPSAELLRPVRPWTCLRRRMSPSGRQCRRRLPARAAEVAPLVADMPTTDAILVPGQSDRGAPLGEQPPGSAPSSCILPPIPGPADDDDAKDCHRYPVSVDWRRRDHSICGGTTEAPLQRRFATAAHSVHVDCGSR